MALVATTNIVYIPTFDADTGTYVDVSPFKKGSRKNPSYECRCKLDGKSFTTKTQFDAHCKTQTHKNFIQNYEMYYKDTDKANQEIRDLKIQCGKYDKRVREYRHKLEVANAYLNQERKKNKLLTNELQKHQDKEMMLINDASDDEDDLFLECN